MAEFKVNDALTGEVSAFSSTGTEMNSTVSTVEMGVGISTLKAGARFVAEHNSIIELMKLYQQLIAKDADDLLKMKETADTLDATIANSVK